MTTAIYIDPGRFIASDGKLDSNNRYLFRDDGAPWMWFPGPTTRTAWVVGGARVAEGEPIGLAMTFRSVTDGTYPAGSGTGPQIGVAL